MHVLILLIIFSSVLGIVLVPRYLAHIERMKGLEVRRLEALAKAPEEARALESAQDREKLAAELLEAYDEVEQISPTRRDD